MGKAATITGVVGVAIAAAGLVFGSDIHDHFFPPKKNDDVKNVVTLLDQSLNEAAEGRKTISDASVAVNNCHDDTNPWRQANKVDGAVTTNRAFVVAEVSAFGSITDSNAQELVNAFKTAYKRSQRADQDYAAWLHAWQKADGCKPPRNGKWKTFDRHNKSAIAAKKLFLKLYNEPAAQYGLTPRTLDKI